MREDADYRRHTINFVGESAVLLLRLVVGGMDLLLEVGPTAFASSSQPSHMFLMQPSHSSQIDRFSSKTFALHFRHEVAVSRDPGSVEIRGRRD